MSIFDYLKNKLKEQEYERQVIQTNMFSYFENDKMSAWFRFGKFLVYTGKNPPVMGFDIGGFSKETIPDTNYNFVEVIGW